MAQLRILCTFTSEPDGYGHRSFTLRWLDEGRQRGQCFHAVPEQILAPLRAKGHAIEGA